MIKIICVGKIKEKFYKDALLEYQKRLGKYTKLEIIEIPDFSLTPSYNREKEGELILKQIKEKEYVIPLAIDGTLLDSITLSQKLQTIKMSAGTVTFVIGGSDGLSEEVLKRGNFSLSFSKLTFPHQLFRVLLLEQLYRCFKIENGETYHK
jgi:23S rRNA (pseudouridine1915-N3)-methyltransferase